MTPATDDCTPDGALEAAFEALLAGRSAPPAAGGLAAFTDGVRATADRAPRPSAALADLLATGLLTDQSSVPAPRAAARSRRRSTPMFLSSLLGKLASLGLLAKTGAVAGVVVVGVSTAGFTQTLPGSLQTTWDHVVAHDETATTQSGPTSSTPGGTTSGTGETDTSGSQTGAQSATAGSGGETTGTGSTTSTSGTSTSGTGTSATTGNGIGAQVSAGRHDGTLTGSASELAHTRNQARRDGTSSGTSTGTSTGTSEDGSTATSEDGSTATSGDSGSASGTTTEDAGPTGSKGSHGSGHSHG